MSAASFPVTVQASSAPQSSSRNQGVVQDDGSAVLTHDIFFPDDEACGVGALAACDELPELCGLDLGLDSQGAASVAGEADAFGVSLAAVGEYGFAGELCGGHVCEVQVEEGLLCGVVHKDQVADLSVCHVVVGHSSSSSLFFVYKKDPWNTGLNDGCLFPPYYTDCKFAENPVKSMDSGSAAQFDSAFSAGK